MKSAAEPVEFAVFLGFIVLFAILVKTMMSRLVASEFVGVAGLVRVRLHFAAFVVAELLVMQIFEERRVGFVALAILGVRLLSA